MLVASPGMLGGIARFGMLMMERGATYFMAGSDGLVKTKAGRYQRGRTCH